MQSLLMLPPPAGSGDYRAAAINSFAPLLASQPAHCLELLLIQVVVNSGTVDQLGVSAEIDDTAVMHHKNSVGIHNC